MVYIHTYFTWTRRIDVFASLLYMYRIDIDNQIYLRTPIWNNSHPYDYFEIDNINEFLNIIPSIRHYKKTMQHTHVDINITKILLDDISIHCDNLEQ